MLDITDPFQYPINKCEVLFLPSRPVLNRLGQVRWGDIFIARQIGNRPRDLEHAMKRACAQLQLLASRRKAQYSAAQ